MKKTNQKRIPKFKSSTLDRDDLRQVIGGLPPETATFSQCHVDGTDDGDPGWP